MRRRVGCLLLGLCLVWAGTARGEIAYVLDGDPSQQVSRTLISWPTLPDFAGNTNQSIEGSRTTASSSGISITADGTFYQLVRAATTTGTADLVSWPSVSSYVSGASGTTLGTSVSLGQSSGFHVSAGGAVYFLEGDPRVTPPSSRNLYRWSSVADFAAGTTGTLLGSSTLNAGLGLSVGASQIFFLDGSPVNSGAKKIVVWPTLADFFNDTNSTSYNNASTTTSSGLAIVVPEPAGALLLFSSLGTAMVAAGVRCRRFRHQRR